MHMRKFITKVRREMTVSAVVRDGEKLRNLRAARAGIDSDIWPDDARAFDEMIDSLERRQRSRREFLKTTA
jgi:hypothetical protein